MPAPLSRPTTPRMSDSTRCRVWPQALACRVLDETRIDLTGRARGPMLSLRLLGYIFWVRWGGFQSLGGYVLQYRRLVHGFIWRSSRMAKGPRSGGGGVAISGSCGQARRCSADSARGRPRARRTRRGRRDALRRRFPYLNRIVTPPTAADSSAPIFWPLSRRITPLAFCN